MTLPALMVMSVRFIPDCSSVLLCYYLVMQPWCFVVALQYHVSILRITSGSESDVGGAKSETG